MLVHRFSKDPYQFMALVQCSLMGRPEQMDGLGYIRDSTEGSHVATIIT